MPNLSYRALGLVFGKSRPGASNQQVRDLQHVLRCLGYLKSGIDGQFGDGTERAVKALQFDLLHNDGKSTGGDGAAPARVLDYNRGRVAAVTGAVDKNLAACLSDMLDDSAFPTAAGSDRPGADIGRSRD